MWRLPIDIKRFLLLFVALFLCLARPLLVRAECSLAFTPIEESKYLLTGKGCEEVAQLAVTLDYDTAYLFAPEVTVMGGMLLEQDRGASTPPGTLRLQIRKENNDPSFEATVYFQKRGEYPAVINFVTAEAAQRSGEVGPLQVQMAEPVNTPEEDPAASNPAGEPVSPAPESDAEALARELGATQQADSVPQAPAPTKAVFERFRDFTGKKSLAAFLELFSGVDPCCRQVPAVVVADGRRTARLVIGGVEVGNRAPIFSVSGGTLVSAQRGGNDEEWIAVVQPYEKWWDVRVKAIFANAVLDLPLTATPAIEIPLRKLAQIKESAFMPRLQDFLAEKPGKAQSPYPAWFREYLFTANYLAAREELAMGGGASQRGTSR